jgi:hypothetical protein
MVETFYRFLHPTVGGPEGTGWPLGRPLFANEMSTRLQTAAGVDFVTDLQLRIFDPAAGLYGPPVDRVEPSALGILIAGASSVTVQP